MAADLTSEQIAIGNGAPTPDDRLYVTCHQCDNCGHIGINDEHPTESACNRGLCSWHGPSPAEDVCPGCGEHGTMSTACPECGGHYMLLAEARLPLPAAGVRAGETPSKEVRELMLLAATDLAGWAKQYDDAASADTAKRLREAALGVDLPDGAKR